MKILITCQYYWPDNFLINEIAEDLVKRGNKVTVLTGLPDYATTKIPKEYKLGRRKEIHNGVEIIRVPIIARHHGFIMRVINYLSYFISSSIYAKTHDFNDYDVIYAYQLAPILMVNPGMIIKKKYNIPMFIYVLDLWPDQMKIWHVNEGNPIFKLVLKYCQKAYGSGDIVGITSKPFENYLISMCNVNKNKIVYLPQHSNKLEIKNLKNSKNDIVNFIFAGNIGQQQNIECLIESVSLMNTKKRFLVNIYGEGTSFEKCKEYNLDIQPYAPVFNVIKVIFDSFSYGCVSAVTIHLSPAGKSRANLMFHHISRDFFSEFLYKKRPLRSWSHKTHVTLQYVEKLWQFINTGVTHKLSDGCYSWVILYCPCLLLFRFRLYFHGTELVHPKSLVMKSNPLLFIDQWSR